MPNAWGGIVGGTFHVVVSGAPSSFFEKYGDLEDRRNLCSRKDSPAVVTVMSLVMG